MDDFYSAYLGQQLTLHPHLHCIVPAGGLTSKQIWKQARLQGKFLFPVKAMSLVFRAKYATMLKERIPVLEKHFLDNLFKKKWVIYARRPFGSPEAVVEYIGRYTHKITISNHRIKEIDADGKVTFSYKDYRKQGPGMVQEMVLEGMEFIRRFSMHILPKAFVRIRHFGILSSSSKKRTIPIIRAKFKTLFAEQNNSSKAQKHNPTQCPHCRTDMMVVIELLPKRGPPTYSKNSVLRKNISI